ncbi:MAG: hypothetical protein AAF439_13175 [Pseudomonadota bacterium]
MAATFSMFRAPRSPRGISRLWIGLALVVAGLGVVAVWQLAAQNAPVFVTMRGRLTNEIAARPVIAPAGTRIIEILIADGDHVEAGDPLAKVSWDGLEEERTALKELEERLIARLDCLRTDAGLTGNEAAVPEPANAGLHKAIDRENCTIGLQKLSAEMSTHWQQEALLEERIRLLRQALTVAGAESHLPDGQEGSSARAGLKRILQIRLAYNQARTQMAQHRAKTRRAAIDIREARLQLMEETLTVLAGTRTRLDELIALSRDPFISAATAGQISRIRAPDSSTRLQADTAIMQIREDDADWVVRAEVDDETALGIRAGDPTRLRLGSILASSALVDGSVRELQSEPRSGRIAQSLVIDLAPASVARLMKRDGMRVDPGSWALVDIEIGQQPNAALITNSIFRQGDLCQLMPATVGPVCNDGSVLVPAN